MSTCGVTPHCLYFPAKRQRLHCVLNPMDLLIMCTGRLYEWRYRMHLCTATGAELTSRKVRVASCHLWRKFSLPRSHEMHWMHCALLGHQAFQQNFHFFRHWIFTGRKLCCTSCKFYTPGPPFCGKTSPTTPEVAIQLQCWLTRPLTLRFLCGMKEETWKKTLSMINHSTVAAASGVLAPSTCQKNMRKFPAVPQIPFIAMRITHSL